jgi:hypothetical protein
VFTLSPSDFAFLWRDCRRCYWRKVVLGRPRPSGGLPGVFTTIDRLMKQWHADGGARRLAPNAPWSRLMGTDLRLQSRAITIDGLATGAVIDGRADAVVQWEDAAFGVIDYKTSGSGARAIGRYTEQLHGYAYAAERAAPRARTFVPVTRLALLVFEPTSFTDADDGVQLGGRLAWHEIPRDMPRFEGFLREVLTVLNGAEPAPREGCAFCTPP